MVKIITKIESLAFFLLCLYFYYQIHGSWSLFFLLWLLPDLSMVGYLQGRRVGAIVYNFIHNYTPALLLTFVGLWQNNSLIISLGIIFVSHVAMDRFCGFGLKYESGFKDTHIQKL